MNGFQLIDGIMGNTRSNWCNQFIIRIYDKIQVNIAKSESTGNTVEGILLKLLDRIQRESEQQNDERNRRHEAMLEALGDVEKQLSRMDGIMSRMNGNGK